MKKILSKAQQDVINCLKDNYKSYIHTSIYYNYQQVISFEQVVSKYGEKTHHLMYFTKPTFNVLVRVGAIKEESKYVYILNPEF